MSERARTSIPRFIPMPSPNFDCRKRRDIQAIVLHGTASNDGLRELVRLRNPSSRASAHYLVDRDGRTYQLVADRDRAWHAGLGRWKGRVVDLDELSIGIEVVGDGREAPPYTEEQYWSLSQLVSRLLANHHLERDAVVCHWAVAEGRDDGPFNFELEDVWAVTPPEEEEEVVPVPAARSVQEPRPVLVGE